MNMFLAFMLVGQVTAGSSQTAPNPLTPREPRPRQEVISPEAFAAANKLFELAIQEATADTNYPAEFLVALDSTSGHVRQNAFATVGIVVSTLRNADDARSQGRYVALTQRLRAPVLEGIRDVDGVTRRYAFLALVTIDAGRPGDTGRPGDLTSTVALAQRLFKLDQEPTVRAAALDFLLSQGRSRGRNWALIEEALSDPSPTVKSAAYREASTSGAGEAIPYLLRGLNDESDQWARVTAAEALRPFVVTNPEVVDAVATRVTVESNAYIKELLKGMLSDMRTKKR